MVSTEHFPLYFLETGGGAEAQLDSGLVLARLLPDGGVCGGGGWVGSTGKMRSAGGRGSQRMLAGFWRMSMLGREVGMAFVVGDRDPGDRLPRWSWRNWAWLDQRRAAQGRLQGHCGA